MAEIGHGYGSEWHLLRYLGRHRQELDRRILAMVDGTRIEWLDFGFDASNLTGDRELQGVEFLGAAHPAREAWSTFWASRGKSQNWDAVGRIRGSGIEEWLLVEAKAHCRELTSDCGANMERAGFARISEAFRSTKERPRYSPGA